MTATPEAAEELLTAAQVAALLKFTRTFVYELMRNGEFGELVELGPQSRRITMSGYRAYIERKKVSAS